MVMIFHSFLAVYVLLLMGCEFCGVNAHLGFPMLYLGGISMRQRGASSGMPSVSRFRSGYMPSGMTATRVTSNVSGSDMDTLSDSEGECYGSRYSPEASPQDDKHPNGGAKHRVFHDVRSGNARGGYSAVFVEDDESSGSSSSEVSPTPRRHTPGIVLQRKFKLGTNFQSSVETVRRVRILHSCSMLNSFAVYVQCSKSSV